MEVQELYSRNDNTYMPRKMRSGLEILDSPKVMIKQQPQPPFVGHLITGTDPKALSTW